jgi:hypothetical protein
MADEYLFAGGRLDAFTFSAGAAVELTTSGRFDASFADCAIALDTGDTIVAGFTTASSGVLVDTTVVSGETLYFHGREYIGYSTAVGANMIFAVYDNAGFPWLALRTGNVSATMTFAYNSGTGGSPTWTALTTQVGSNGTTFTWDLKLTIGSPHSVELSVDGSVIYSGTFTQASFTDAAEMRLTGGSATSVTFWSEIICSRGIPLVGARLQTLRPSGAGSNSGFTSGAYTNVNEAIGSDATFDSSATAAQKQSYAMGDFTLPANFAIGAVYHWMRAKQDGAAPVHIQSLIRSGGTDYMSSDLSPGTSFGAVGMRYVVDPDGPALSDTGINGWEVGYKSTT